MNWGDYKQEVLKNLPLDKNREGVQDLIIRCIKAAVMDLQSHISAYRKGHDLLMAYSDFMVDGKASYAYLPSGVEIAEAYFMCGIEKSASASGSNKPGSASISASGSNSNPDPGDNCDKRIPLTPYPWEKRWDLICGCNCQGGLISIAPTGTTKQFYVYPPLQSGDGVVIYYDGIKSVFNDADIVPFDDASVEAVAAWVAGQLARIADKDLNLMQSFMQDYQRLRQRLYVDCANMAKVRRI